MYTQTVLFIARVDAQIAVYYIQLLEVHVMDQPYRPRVALRAGQLGLLVPFRRQCVGDVGSKVQRDGRLVLMKPVLDTTSDIVNAQNVKNCLFSQCLKSYYYNLLQSNISA